MKALCTMAFIAGASFALSTAAIAQDTTTTTTTTTAPSGPPGAFVGVPGVAGVQVGGPGRDGCTTRNTTQTNGEGDSRSATATNC
jgi:hypothetical protein